ncbi:hypothetical protein niasHT_000553 [Heterodera trifolii]|uniref:Uncharacterized protein n=1 Tax=Heterodera trifolii TaxID=157864 RepID=A0ABD2M7F8_9BILA
MLLASAFAAELLKKSKQEFIAKIDEIESRILFSLVRDSKVEAINQLNAEIGGKFRQNFPVMLSFYHGSSECAGAATATNGCTGGDEKRMMERMVLMKVEQMDDSTAELPGTQGGVGGRHWPVDFDVAFSLEKMCPALRLINDQCESSEERAHSRQSSGTTRR